MNDEMLISMRTFRDEGTGRYGVEVILSGLQTEVMAEIVKAKTAELLGGPEILRE